MSWTEEKVAKLKELWSKGHTASQIAQALGDNLKAIYDKSSKSLAKHGGIKSEDGLLWGKIPENH